MCSRSWFAFSPKHFSTKTQSSSRGKKRCSFPVNMVVLPCRYNILASAKLSQRSSHWPSSGALVTYSTLSTHSLDPTVKGTDGSRICRQVASSLMPMISEVLPTRKLDDPLNY